MNGGFQSYKGPVSIDRIVVPEGRRPLDEENVLALMASMKLIGLRQPINLVGGNIKGLGHGQLRLVAGRHRLEAARRLGWPSIDTLTFEGDNLRTAELAEIVENLHRKDLGAMERAEAIARFDKIAAVMNAEREAEEKEAEAKTSEISPIIASKTRPKKGTGVGRGANQKKGPRKGSNVDVADQFGLNKETIRKDRKIAKALKGDGDSDHLTRAAKLPQFDKPAAAKALASMTHEQREEVIAKAERGEVVKIGKSTASTAFEQVKRLLPKLTTDERRAIAAMLAS